MADWVLRGGSIVDGLGSPRYDADLVIRGGRIRELAEPGTRVPGAHELDVSGLVIAPGFIDMHAHSDLAVLADPLHVSKVAQGVTLEVVGQDGLGYSPVTDEVMAVTRAQIAGWNGSPDLDYSWRTVAEYLARVDLGAPVNVAVLVPHGTARMTVMGTQARSATSAELDDIREIVAQGLRDGAMGMSTGLTYTPGMYASDEEIVDALGAVHEQGGYYCPHHRNYGSRVVEAYVECIEIAVKARVPLHLAHTHVNYPQNHGRAGEVLAAIDLAVSGGADITLDSYPYLSGATYLAAVLPSWTHEHGAQATIDLLTDPASRARILGEMEQDGSDGFHGVPMAWHTITISSTSKSENDWATGLTIPELAERSRTAPGTAFADLLIADELGTGCLVGVGNEENVREVMLHDSHTVGTDGILVGNRPHPRGWGSFPRFIGTYARDLGLLTLEQAVMHCTSRPAYRLGLLDRGALVRGHWADLVVFDPNTIASPATYEEPTQPPIGVHHVFVNGVPTLENGVRTVALPGKAIRRT